MESWSLTRGVLDLGQKKMQNYKQLEVDAQENWQKIEQGLAKEERDSEKMSKVVKYPQQMKIAEGMIGNIIR